MGVRISWLKAARKDSLERISSSVHEAPPLGEVSLEASLSMISPCVPTHSNGRPPFDLLEWNVSKENRYIF
jgi:hypothetical protein